MSFIAIKEAFYTRKQQEGPQGSWQSLRTCWSSNGLKLTSSRRNWGQIAVWQSPGPFQKRGKRICRRCSATQSSQFQQSENLLPLLCWAKFQMGAWLAPMGMVSRTQFGRSLSKGHHLYGGVDIPCLLDTETQSFFAKHFETGSPEKLKACHWIRLRAANGLAIPTLAVALELDFQMLGKKMS